MSLGEPAVNDVKGPADGAVPHVFVVDLDEVDPDPTDRHHLERVLRVRSGDPITVSDGEGRWRTCRYGAGALEVTSPIELVPAPQMHLSVAFALTKATKPELVVQKLTEIGIDTIVPFLSDRSIVRWDSDKSERNATRLRRVAREAAMQSRRTRVPTVAPIATFASLAGTGVVRADRGGVDIDRHHTTVLIGPEGGWSDSEQAGAAAVHLGPHVLRAETAAIVAGVRLMGVHHR